MVNGPESIFSDFYRSRRTLSDRWQEGQTAMALRIEFYYSVLLIDLYFKSISDETCQSLIRKQNRVFDIVILLLATLWQNYWK